jgi:hypothetical protein
MSFRTLLCGAAVLGIASFVSVPHANALLLWGNNASVNDVVEAFDPATGAVVHQYATAQGGNGRGVVTVGNVVYYTSVGDGNIYKLDANTGTFLGSIATGQSSLATIAYDGTNFYLGDYSGSNKVFHFNVGTGLVDKTITLANCSGNCDGLEYFQVGGQGRLISNRGDAGGPYDVYDTNGNLLTAAFLPGGQTTGVAFDGTDFFVSNIYGNSVSVYDSSGTFIRTTTLGLPLPATGTGQRFIEDLSFDYNVVIPTPEPASLGLLGAGLFALRLLRRRGK